nr:hypothetical protein OA9_18980 [Vibrio cyclitrophicus 1F97]
MSKASLVVDTEDSELIEVLSLGIPTGQENISQNMLVSSVFIDGEGLVWFGQHAIERSNIESQSEPRQRIDNIKRYLSEEGFNTEVTGQFNPTSHEIKFGDMIQAYLMYLTWAVNTAPEMNAYPRNIERRFAMPCFDSGKARNFSQILRTMLGNAQILSDTFYSSLEDGCVPLEDFIEAIKVLKTDQIKCDFVSQEISEPLGVAGSLINWNQARKNLIMVIDVGAGTSDFSLFNIKIDPSQGINTAIQVANSSKGITEAGNHLDELLEHFILQKSPIDYEHDHWFNVMGALKLQMRDYKETLFNEGEVHISLFTGDIVDVYLQEFLSLEAVKVFGESLRNCMTSILEGVDDSFIKSAPKNQLVLALTGGGAELPMVKALALNKLSIHGTEIMPIAAVRFPVWLAEEEYFELEEEYPRIAVSLGGARSKIIESKGVASLTAGDIKQTPKLEGFRMRGV